ncbi:DHH family phosphoesterase [bacterium]|nr:DHH family phosphoesterase [bacterium]
MLSKLVKQLLSVDNIAITSHVNPDGDAIASELAMFEALKSMGKKVCIINPSQTPKVYQFLKFSSEIKTEKLCDFDIGTLITLDVPSLERLGTISTIAENVDLVINIDHHISNTNFGDLNIIDAEASSVVKYCIFYLNK